MFEMFQVFEISKELKIIEYGDFKKVKKYLNNPNYKVLEISKVGKFMIDFYTKIYKEGGFIK
jgi:hypothetical protein